MDTSHLEGPPAFPGTLKAPCLEDWRHLQSDSLAKASRGKVHKFH